MLGEAGTMPDRSCGRLLISTTYALPPPRRVKEVQLPDQCALSTDAQSKAEAPLS